MTVQMSERVRTRPDRTVSALTETGRLKEKRPVSETLVGDEGLRESVADECLTTAATKRTRQPTPPIAWEER